MSGATDGATANNRLPVADQRRRSASRGLIRLAVSLAVLVVLAVVALVPPIELWNRLSWRFDDGTLGLRLANGGGEVSLPADYVAQHVELAYATTAYRSQGRTTDTAHAVVSPATTREVLYVSATRGRESNSLYVDTSFDPDPATSHDGATSQRTARDVLASVLANDGADLSAHESLERAQLLAENFGVLAAEYETLAQAAH